MEGLAKNHASACMVLTAGYGAFTIMPAPAIPGAGAYGSMVFCRTNQAGSTVEVEDGKITLNHGIYKIQVDQKELQDLKDLRDWVRENSKLLIMPPMEPESEGSLAESHTGL